jgi:hypothetical protein
MNRRSLVGGLVAGVVAVLGVCPPLGAGQTTMLSWEEAFPVQAAKDEDVYLDAHFVGSDGTRHRLQVWRRGTDFLHRRTDEALDLYLEKANADADYSYRLFDHQRRLEIAVNRSHLYRIGVFSDWFGLAHIVDRPKTQFTVRAAQPLAGERRSDCSWRLLVRGSGSSSDRSRICWSSKWGVPLVIRGQSANGQWTDQLTVERVGDKAIASDGFALPTKSEGYAYFDAGKEIAPEAGD